MAASSKIVRSHRKDRAWPVRCAGRPFSLYPALQRLEEKGWVDSEWRSTDENRRARYYSLTAAGRRALGAEAESWRRYVTIVDLILRTT